MVTLPKEYVNKYTSFLKENGLTVENDVVEEILYNLAMEGVEDPNFLRFYRSGNAEEKTAFYEIETKATGAVVSTNIQIGGMYYRVGCNT
jgi:hypothetical protein